MTPAAPAMTRDAIKRYTAWEKQLWGANVRSRRKKLGLTLDQLGALADTTAQTISKIETGEIAPRDDLRYALAFALALEVGELFPFATRQALLVAVTR